MSNNDAHLHQKSAQARQPKTGKIMSCMSTSCPVAMLVGGGGENVEMRKCKFGKPVPSKLSLRLEAAKVSYKDKMLDQRAKR